MDDFRYRGTTRDGQTVTGEIRAVSLSEARQALEEQGIRVLQCDATSEPEGTRIEPLSAQDALEWSQQLVQVGICLREPGEGAQRIGVAVGLRLVGGLRRVVAGRGEFVGLRRIGLC